ncbi:MAG TPA: carboxymuconolactone decarboxylase family protein [Acidimicrobiales bacterium]|jgi:4-carboxymuconolactone decarboxylase|nr:carboxymuconolactone decarboxylase family protein [Acidimicrobiales bacterium]HMS88808.1 carboxymuconolactone decarboxylase family protein [Acidimicrobiales bacterium]HRA34101.1 carboxymuconolactone decarboxylase family protein [Acidimicrobiales bacterium]
MSAADDRRARGKEQMRQVYGWDIEPTKPFEEQTVDHLFGEVWAGTDLSVRDRRLVLIGLAVGSGQTDVAGLQADSALRLGELDAADLRYLVTFLAHYAGWPRGAAFNSEVETIIARHEKAAAASDDDLP